MQDNDHLVQKNDIEACHYENDHYIFFMKVMASYRVVRLSSQPFSELLKISKILYIDLLKAYRVASTEIVVIKSHNDL